PRHAHALLHPRRRRVRARLPAHLLVLLAPGGLHHDAARLRDRVRGDLGDGEEADLRLPPDGAVADGDPRARVLRLGAPHVRRRRRPLAAHPDDGHLDGDRGPDRDQGVLLVSDDLGRAGALHDADAVRARLRLDVRDRRPLRDLPRRRADRHPRLGHVLRRRAHPLRPVRRVVVHDLRRDLLLVPEDDGPDVRRAARQAPLLDDLRGLQRHLLPDALAGDAGDAAEGFRLRAAVRRLEHGDLDRLVLPRRLDHRLPLQHDRQLGPRAPRRGKPLARDDARVAGLVAAAVLQLRRAPAGRGQPVRVRRARRTPRGVQRGSRRTGRRGRGAALTHLLVVANETVAGRALADAVKRRGGDLQVTVVSPVNTPREGYVVYADTRRAAADRRLDKTLAQLRDVGISADGFVVEADPVDAVRDALAQLEPPVDEIVVSTHPAERSGWLRKGVVERIRKVAEPLPVEHVVVDLAKESGPANVLVIANETVIGEALLEAIKARAARSPASFLIVSPQSDSRIAGHPDAERRLRRALAALRGAGIDAHGQVAHPDPY